MFKCNPAPNHELVSSVRSFIAMGYSVAEICDNTYSTELELRSYPEIDTMLGNERDTRNESFRVFDGFFDSLS